MTAYYNENDPKAAAWLRNLIAADLIAPGVVDERSIKDVKPSDLTGYTQCHFFAGIGGWSYALRLAGWPDDRPVWTGSCPCQPFSTAGAGEGFDDERHLWPDWFWLVQQCRPATVFGEQVASKAGRSWFDLVSTDLEALDYAVGSSDLCAASVGAPHIRQRLWFVGMADSKREGLQRHRGFGEVSIQERWERTERHRSACGTTDRLADSESAECEQSGNTRSRRSGFADSDAITQGSPTTGTSDTPWRDVDWLWCRDEKWRSVEPGTFPLANGFPRRMDLLRGYGNAIVPQVAQAFIEVFNDT